MTRWFLGVALFALAGLAQAETVPMRDCGSPDAPAVIEAQAILNADFADFALRFAAQLQVAERSCAMDFGNLGVRLFSVSQRLAESCAALESAWVCAPAVTAARFSLQVQFYVDSIEGHLPSAIANGCARLRTNLDRDRPEIADIIDALEASVRAQDALWRRLSADPATLRAFCRARAQFTPLDDQRGVLHTGRTIDSNQHRDE